MNIIRRPIATAVLALAAATGLTGCSLASQQATAIQYAPADGSQVDLEDGIGVRNAMFLSDGEDAPGTLIATIVNESREDAEVALIGEGLQERFTVEAGGTLRLGPDQDEQVVLEQMVARAGEMVTIQVATPSATSELAVPVLDGTQQEFTDLVPSGTATTG